MRVTKVRGVLILAAASAVVAGCTTGAADPPGGSPTSLTVAQATDMLVLDPHSSPGGQMWNFLYNVYEGLYKFDQNGAVVPGLAVADEVSPDGLTHTITLRDGVLFHNETPLTAEDVEFSLQRALDPDFPTTFRGDLGSLASVNATDDRTVEISLKRPNPILANALTSPAALIVPKAYVTEVGDEAFAKQPIGTGPYKFVETRPGQYTKMTAFDRYWGDRPAIKDVTFKVVPEAATRAAMLKADEADMIVGVDPTQVDGLKSDGFTVLSHPTSEVLWLQIRADKVEAFKNADVRKALNLAVNRNAIVENLFGGNATVISSLVGPGILGHDPDLEPYPYDPAEAQRLLREANFDFNQELRFSAPRGRWLKGEDAAQLIANDLNAIGLKVTLQLQDYGVWVDELLNKRSPDMTLDNVSNRIFDIAGPLQSELTCAGSISYFCDSALDAEFSALQSVGGAEREQAMRELSASIHDAAPGVFLWGVNEIYAFSSGLAWTPTPATYVVLFR